MHFLREVGLRFPGDIDRIRRINPELGRRLDAAIQYGDTGITYLPGVTAGKSEEFLRISGLAGESLRT